MNNPKCEAWSLSVKWTHECNWIKKWNIINQPEVPSYSFPVYISSKDNSYPDC